MLLYLLLYFHSQVFTHSCSRSPLLNIVIEAKESFYIISFGKHCHKEETSGVMLGILTQKWNIKLKRELPHFSFSLFFSLTIKNNHEMMTQMCQNEALSPLNL